MKRLVRPSFISLSTEVYGAETSLLSLIGDRDARLIAPEGEFLRQARAQGIACVSITDARILKLRSIGHGVAGIDALRTIGDSSRALSSAWKESELVVSFSQWLNPGLAMVSRHTRFPVVLDMHDGPFTRMGRILQSFSVAFADGAIFVSHSARSDVIGRIPYTTRVAVVPRPVQVEVQDETLRERESPLRVIYSGRLAREKRVHLLLAAVERLPRGDIDLTIVGEGEFPPISSDSYERQHPNVRFVGKVSPERSREFIAASNLLVSPAIGEAFGRTIYEAAQYGVPSVVDSSADAARHIRSRENGWILGNQEWENLHLLLEELARDSALVKAVGARAKETLSKMVNAERVRERYWDFLQRVWEESA